MNQEEHQKKYFGKEFKAIKEYHLDSWQLSYINRIKQSVLGNNYKGKVLLDIGTGGGYVAIEMARLGLNVIACDLTPEAIENLKKYKKQFSLQNIKLIVCSAEKIPMSDSSVDFIIGNAVLEHISGEKVAIIEWKRMLKKNGKIFITTPLKYRYLWPFLWPINYIHDKRIGHLRRYCIEDLTNKFKMFLEKVYYTGHLSKIIGIIISSIVHSQKLDQYIETKDRNVDHIRYGASNISVVLSNRRKVNKNL